MSDFEMPSSSQWLDMLKEEIGLETDSEVAAYLKRNRQIVSHWRQERNQIGIADAVPVGNALGVNPLFIILCSQYHADKDKGSKWRTLATAVEPKPDSSRARKRRAKRRLNPSGSKGK